MIAPSSDERQTTLGCHTFPTPGKLAVISLRQAVNPHDLSLAYAPGVAEPCEETDRHRRSGNSRRYQRQEFLGPCHGCFMRKAMRL